MQRGVATSHQVGTLEGDEGLEVFERRAYFGLSNCTFGFIFLKLQKSVDKLQKRWFFRQMSGICTKSEAHSNSEAYTPKTRWVAAFELTRCQLQAVFGGAGLCIHSPSGIQA
jgi:hypothetical protein